MILKVSFAHLAIPASVRRKLVSVEAVRKEVKFLAAGAGLGGVAQSLSGDLRTLFCRWRAGAAVFCQ